MNRKKLAVLAALLISGLGATRVQGASGVRELRLAQQHLSAVLLVQRWAEIGYRIGPAPEETCEPIPPDGVPAVPVEQPDGSFRIFRRSLDCSEGFTEFREGSADFLVQTRRTDGVQETATFVASGFVPDIDPPVVQAYDVDHRLSTGDSARYTVRFEVLAFPEFGFFLITGQTTEGEMISASGETVQFLWVQPRPLLDEFPLRYTDTLDLTLPSRERLHWEIPVVNTDFGDVIDFSRPAPGTYRAGTSRINFTVSGSEGQFRQWTISDGRGLSGLFNLNQDFSGRGRALRRRKLQFVGSWNTQARGTVLLANGQAAVAGPSAGAQDFGAMRFRALGLANAPAPGF
jgi:hypothetical protein